MSYLLGLLGLLLGGLLYNNTKRKSAEVLIENLEVKNQANALDKEASKNSGLLEAEEEKRKAIEEKKNEESNKDPVDFINNRYPSK